MTGRELILKLKVKLNHLDTSTNRSIQAEEALIFINDAVKKLVVAKYFHNEGAIDQSSLDLNQKTKDDLNALIKTVDMSTHLEQVDDTMWYFKLNEITDYLFYANAQLEVETKGKKLKVLPNLDGLDRVMALFKDPFNKPDLHNPVMVFQYNKIAIFTDGEYKITGGTLTYGMNHPEITLESELLVPFYEEVIDTATELVLENWGSPRTQTITQLNTYHKNK